MDEIKLAFQKVKQDILLLNDEVSMLKDALDDINFKLDHISNKIDTLQKNNPTETPTHASHETATPTHTPTVPYEAGGLKTPLNPFSIGNEGVPTDRHTTDN